MPTSLVGEATALDTVGGHECGLGRVHGRHVHLTWYESMGFMVLSIHPLDGKEVVRGANLAWLKGSR